MTTSLTIPQRHRQRSLSGQTHGDRETGWQVPRRCRTSSVQARSDSSSVSATQSSPVPGGLLYVRRWRRQSSASTFRQSSSARGAASPSQHVRPSGLRSSQWLVRCPGTHYRTVSTSRRVMTTFQTTVSNIHWKHFSLVDIDVPSALEVFTTLRYINLHLLTYLHDNTALCVNGIASRGKNCI